jgi:hypothetical protein
MKARAGVVTLALATGLLRALPLLGQTPAYLKDMPAVDRVMSAMHASKRSG